MTCERCGTEISHGLTVCPVCRTPTPTASAQEGVPKQTSYGAYPRDEYGDPQPIPTYEQGYQPWPPVEEPPRLSYAPPPPPPQYNTGYASSFNAPPQYQQPQINVTVVNTFAAPSPSKSNALLVEIICSLFGIYGVGWLVAGETTTGIILLVCSFLLIWPAAIAIAVFTLGFGIFFCNLPLTIVGIILNAIFLNKALNRKTVQYRYSTAQAQPMQQMPPRRMPQ